MKFRAASPKLLRTWNVFSLFRVSARFCGSLCCVNLFIHECFRAYYALIRILGSLARSLRMRSLASQEMLTQFLLVQGREPSVTSLTVSCTVLPLKGISPSSIMQRMTPTLHISHFSLYFPVKTSGATYSGVPHFLPSSPLMTLVPKPQSMIFTIHFPSSFFIRMFSAFRSRCVMPFVCVQWIPFRIQPMISEAFFSVKGFSSTISVNSSRPSKSQVTRKNLSLTSQNSQSFRMLGWSSFINTSISSFVGYGPIELFRITFRARLSFSDLCSTLYTDPNEPDPSFFSTVYSSSKLKCRSWINRSCSTINDFFLKSCLGCPIGAAFPSIKYNQLYILVAGSLHYQLISQWNNHPSTSNSNSYAYTLSPAPSFVLRLGLNPLYQVAVLSRTSA